MSGDFGGHMSGAMRSGVDVAAVQLCHVRGGQVRYPTEKLSDVMFMSQIKINN